MPVHEAEVALDLLTQAFGLFTSLDAGGADALGAGVAWPHVLLGDVLHLQIKGLAMQLFGVAEELFFLCFGQFHGVVVRLGFRVSLRRR